MGKDLKGKELGIGISQLKDGRYRGRYTNRFGRRMPPIYSWNLKEVKELLNKVKYEDKLGKDNVVHTNITVDEAYKLWIAREKQNFRETTISQKRKRYLRYIKPEYQFVQVVNVNDDLVNGWMAELISQNLCMGTMINIKAVFSGIMDYCVEHKIYLNNAFKNYKFPKTIKDKAKKEAEKRKRTKFLNVEQQEIFLNAVKARHNYMFPLCRLLIATGLRIGEGIALKWEHIDFSRRLIFIEDGYSEYYEDGEAHITHEGLTKTPTSSRIVPMSNEAHEVLMEIKQQAEADGEMTAHGLLFRNTKGEPLRYMYVQSCLRNTMARIKRQHPDINMPDITPHWFRHTFATACLEHDINLKAVQSYLGHASIAITADLYSHVTDKWVIKEIQKLNQ